MFKEAHVSFSYLSHKNKAKKISKYRPVEYTSHLAIKTAKM